MGIEINITPENVDDLVRTAIMKSALGEAVQKAVTDCLNGYNSPVKAAVEQCIRLHATALIAEKFSDTIHESVKATIEKVVTQQLIDRSVEEASKRLVDAANWRNT